MSNILWRATYEPHPPLLRTLARVVAKMASRLKVVLGAMEMGRRQLVEDEVVCTSLPHPCGLPLASLFRPCCSVLNYWTSLCQEVTVNWTRH